jgi:hypothetical protein
MRRIKHTVEQIITKLHETEVVLSKGASIRVSRSSVSWPTTA